MESLRNPEEFIQEVESQPNLDENLKDGIVESEVAGGAWLDKLAPGKSLEVQTRHTLYTIEKRADGLYISGHPKYCPEPVPVNISGSTFGGSSIKSGFIGIGLHMEFYIDGKKYVSSEIADVKEI